MESYYIAILRLLKTIVYFQMIQVVIACYLWFWIVHKDRK